MGGSRSERGVKSLVLTLFSFGDTFGSPLGWSRRLEVCAHDRLATIQVRMVLRVMDEMSDLGCLCRSEHEGQGHVSRERRWEWPK